MKEFSTASISWKAPSNIALVKYWGKKPNLTQIPANPSISFTLSECYTKTELKISKATKNRGSVKVYYNNELKPSFLPKIETFIQRIEPYLLPLSGYEIEINTQNTFPHSSGIASSASGFAALALCFTSLKNYLAPLENFRQFASFLARLGSGSAARSIFPEIAIWGSYSSVKNSHDEYAIDWSKHISHFYKNIQDTILIVEEGQKEVSSSLGHSLLEKHWFAKSRFTQAQYHLKEILSILKKENNWNDFAKIVEMEALSLHAMMMTSHSPFILMQPNTLSIIKKIKESRANGLKICFTLDAGANVHVLYPIDEKTKVIQFIDQKLSQHCKNKYYICDSVGKGPELIYEQYTS